MEYTRLGKTGLQVSKICLGCMSYGDAGKGHHSWVLDEETARPFYKAALDAGINFFDTANMYALGSSEEFLGRAIKDLTNREDVVIATKVFFPMTPAPNAGGLSRKAIFRQVDASLKRLGTDYIDLYQIHRLDPNVQMEEILEALHDVVKAGKVRYLGASSMQAWQFAKMLYLADLHGWTRFVSMQPHYNLLYREEEREMLNLCREEGIGVIPWSPLARGHLTRPWKSQTTARTESDNFGKTLYAQTEAEDKKIVDAVNDIATKRGIAPAQVALAWVLKNPVITAPIVGATKPHHLQDAISALQVKLTAEEVTALEQCYVPHAVAGFS